LAKDQFTWTTEAHNAFEQLKNAISKAPVLLLPNFAFPFVVEIDVSRVGMGVVLSQQGHPIAFFSKCFFPKLLSSSTYVREFAAITAAVKKWRQCLLGHPELRLEGHQLSHNHSVQPSLPIHTRELNMEGIHTNKEPHNNHNHPKFLLNYS